MTDRLETDDRTEEEGVPPAHDPADAELDALLNDFTDPDDDTTGPDESSSPEAILREELNRIARERDEAREQLLRVTADFQNARRQAERRMEQDRKFANENLVRQLLPVMDNFDRTVLSLDAGVTPEQLRDGILAVQRQMLAALGTVGVERIAALHEAFDPEVHEAIAMEASSEYEDGTIVAELEAGYRLADRVIRPARVKVVAN